MENTEIKMPAIKAKSVKEFQEIEAKLRKLPDFIIKQIDLAENHHWLTLWVNKYPAADNKIYIPNTCTQISNFDDYIGCYCDDLFFKIPTELWKNITYIFSPINEPS